MGETWQAKDAGEALAAVNQALEAKSTLELLGTGSRRELGRPVEAEVVLDLSGLSGVRVYEPEELILVVAPGTTMAEIDTLLKGRNQHLAFEPPDHGVLWGLEPGEGTIGGAILTGRSGPRRLVAGGARDHVLGIKGINGFGDSFVAGGRVVKNVTGFDVPKLVTGSFGTLCVLTELTLKVLPAPADTATLVLVGLDDSTAIAAMRRSINELSVQVSAAAHLPADVAQLSSVESVAEQGDSVTLLRLEGFGPSVTSRLAALQDLMNDEGSTAMLDCPDSGIAWAEIANATFFAGSDGPVWRLSVPPSRGADAGQRLARELGGRRFYDGAGGSVWIETTSAPDAHAAQVRTALHEIVGDDGHATLMRAPAPVRSAVSPFQPRSSAVEAVEERLRRHFDPVGIFNPGRMYERA